MLEDSAHSPSEAADRLYALVDLHEAILDEAGRSDLDQRQILIDSIRHVCSM